MHGSGICQPRRSGFFSRPAVLGFGVVGLVVLVAVAGRWLGKGAARPADRTEAALPTGGAGAGGCGPALGAASPAGGREAAPNPWSIEVDVRRRLLVLYRDGRPARTYPVAVGKEGWPSPVGEWRITRKARDWGGGFGTRWLGLDVPWGIYGIHGTNKDWSIGRAESHGCLRMFNRDVEELWDLVPEGTPVVICGPWELPFWQVRAGPPFAPGREGQAVVFLQLSLRRAGFDAGRAHGRYGAATEAAVRGVQRFYGLPEDGVTDRWLLWLLTGGESF